jgi:hypothetical protein
MGSSINEGRLAVYTVLMGQVAELNPIVEDANIDYICFTDQDLPSAFGWELRRISPILPDDIPRSSRHPKILPHLYLPEYKKSIYLDSSVELSQSPQGLWNHLITDEKTLFGGIYHSLNFTLLEELLDVAQLKYESSAAIERAVRDLQFEIPEFLFLHPVWGGVLARRHMSEPVVASMERWYGLLEIYSRRDQISLPVALKLLRTTEIELRKIDNRFSEFHRWPVRGYTKPKNYTIEGPNLLPWQPWISEKYERLVENLSVPKVAERDSLLTERDSLLTERDSLLTERDSLVNSRSWRITGPLRAASRLFQGIR